MQEKLIPIGTKIHVIVIMVEIAQGTPTCPMAVTAGLCGTNEAIIVLGVEHKVAPQVDKEYLAVFQKGGPKGGYWQIICTWEEHLQKCEGFGPNGDGTTPGFTLR